MPPRLTLDPDCVAGKHHACLGNAWDHDTDMPTDCACACHEKERTDEH
jgi:hypothetical protein